MPTTRKKIIKTVFKDEDSEGEDGDFSDSGSDANFSGESTSDEESEDEAAAPSSGDEFNEKPNVKHSKPKTNRPVKKTKFAQTFISKLNIQKSTCNDNENTDDTPVLFSVKDLSDADKLLPSVLNLSESDSSDDESQSVSNKKNKNTLNSIPGTSTSHTPHSDNEEEIKTEYKDVWSSNLPDNSEEIAKQTFTELEMHKTKIEETKASIKNYLAKSGPDKVSDVKDLLAMGEDVAPQKSPAKKKGKMRKKKDDSDSELEDWEEVQDSKSNIPQQGIQLVVQLPDSVSTKTKKVDVEMMMKRKMNRVKKEYQVYMHKVHVLCWLGHGNYVSKVINDQEIMAAALSLVPSKSCYPQDRVDMKYIEQITIWFKDKLTLKLDKNENKFRPKAPPLITILLEQIKRRVVTAKKYIVFIFVAMLRALGLQCRVMFNFVALPIKPPSSELCSLSTKPKEENNKKNVENPKTKPSNKTENKTKPKQKKIPQLDGADDCSLNESDSDLEELIQLDGNDDTLTVKTRSVRSTRAKHGSYNLTANDDDVSPPKRNRKSVSSKKDDSNNSTKQSSVQKIKKVINKDAKVDPEDTNGTELKAGTKVGSSKRLSLSLQNKSVQDDKNIANPSNIVPEKSASPRKTRRASNKITSTINPSKSITTSSRVSKTSKPSLENPPKITITDENQSNVASSFFNNLEKLDDKLNKPMRKRSRTTNPVSQKGEETKNKTTSKAKTRTKSAPGTTIEKSKYFSETESPPKKPKLSCKKITKKEELLEDKQRVSHKDLTKAKVSKNDVSGDLVDIIKKRIRNAKEDAKLGIVKGKIKKESDDDSDYLPEENPKKRNSDSDDEFKPIKISPKPKTIDRRVLSTDDESMKSSNKIDVWCEVFIEELEQWIAVDIVRGKVHCANDIYNKATHPVCYCIGWDNSNYLKDLSRRYVPHWNTVTRKQRAEPLWWEQAVKPWMGPRSARDREEDESLDRMQLEAPLPKSISEYKNHPLYALKRHLLKFEAIYPPDAATLGFVRAEAVYARDCVYVCRSRDTWLKEAKVVRRGETPYKVVKARPKWDKLSNKLITDKPLEVFGPWQVQDYEPPVAENGVVPRNAYGNVELFKACMLPKGTAHIKLPGLNKVAKKLNIDCAPAMTGFDFNGGWSHPVYDGFVVCKEFEEIIMQAWLDDQEEQERREVEKTELRVYGHWRRLIKGLLIRERLKLKYGFEKPSTSQSTKSKAPKFVAKKRS